MGSRLSRRRPSHQPSWYFKTPISWVYLPEIQSSTLRRMLPLTCLFNRRVHPVKCGLRVIILPLISRLRISPQNAGKPAGPGASKTDNNARSQREASKKRRPRRGPKERNGHLRPRKPPVRDDPSPLMPLHLALHLGPKNEFLLKQNHRRTLAHSLFEKPPTFRKNRFYVVEPGTILPYLPSHSTSPNPCNSSLSSGSPMSVPSSPIFVSKPG